MDVLAELQDLCVDLASVRHSTLPSPFDDEPSLPFGNSSQKKGEYLCMLIGGDFMFFVERGRFRLYLGDS